MTYEQSSPVVPHSTRLAGKRAKRTSDQVGFGGRDPYVGSIGPIGKQLFDCCWYGFHPDVVYVRGVGFTTGLELEQPRTRRLHSCTARTSTAEAVTTLDQCSWRTP